MQKKRHAFCMTSFLWAVLLLLSACDHASGSNAVLQSDITKAESTQTTTDNALKQIHPSTSMPIVRRLSPWENWSAYILIRILMVMPQMRDIIVLLQVKTG